MRVVTRARSDPKQAAGVAAEDLLAIGRAQTGLHDDVPRPLVPHVEAVVAAEHDAIGSHQPDEEPEELRRVTDRVVVEPAHILAEGPLRRVLDLLTNRLAVLEATPEVRQRPTGAGENDVEEIGRASG